MEKASLQKNIYNPIIEKKVSGFLDNLDLDKLKNDCVDGVIKKGMEYRPDLVADYYLGDSSLSWLITYVNNFFNGIKDYKVGTKIKIPKI